jgi:signal transduction histidine kinase
MNARMRQNFRHHAWHHRWHASVARRLLVVIVFTGLLALVLWGIGHHVGLDEQMVYAYGTALPIWFLSDVLRQRLFPSTDGLAWTRGKKVKIFIFFSIVLGFVIGTLLGDWYSGFSTLNLLKFAPQKLAGLVVLCVAMSLAFTVFFYQQNKLQVAEKLATESKLQLLQSQLEPHMLFNTLANLRVLIDVDAVRAQAMLDRLIDYLRATLGASRVTSHALALEFARLDDYLALLQIRMGARLSYTLSLPDHLKTLPCPALILQPLVENAVLHGLEPSAKGGEIVVSAAQSETHLTLTVADTGLGLKSTATPGEVADLDRVSTSGFGLTQLRERLATLYGTRAEVHLASHQPQGTIVTITLPLSTHHESNFCTHC